MSAEAPPARHWLLAEKRAPLPPPGRGHRPFRKLFHLLCFLVFLVLPFSNLMRFDIPRQRFFFAGFEVLISEFSILFFALMFLMFVIAVVAIMYGRVYCGYACPQMIFSEASTAVEAWAARMAQKWTAQPAARKALGKGLFLAILAVASVFLAFVFMAYFIEPRDLLGRLARFDLASVGGIMGASVTLVTFLDFSLVKQTFCTTVCPYGYMQGMLQDKHSLLVAYQDPANACIDCRKCVRVCEMGIDIRKGPYQIECVHCGDCIDACDEVLAKVGHPGLIHYSWGGSVAAAAKEPWYRRWGFRDPKRFVILFVMVAYLTALGLTLWLRKPVLMRLTPDRTTLFTVLPDGSVANRVRMNLANRSPKPVQIRIWVEGLPGARVVLDPNPLTLAPGAALERSFDIAAPAGDRELNPIRVVFQSSDRGASDAAEMNFFMPTRRN
ncbi:4Fe-4S dicluster domain-containing protein [Mesoterricola silvestris]|uniref:Protein RdxA n=1 Tax=Mesoterricola silvestris TaxID=2927979 RepID=A0AA48GK64_9BACT|nr:4Fe-4S dicluster domain-containing protein [Mesoterricola silvestris]BDU71264.1 protein RdxA [Mesoterricola silvestris]